MAFCVILECPIFFIGIILALSTVTAYFFKKIKVPPIIIYILSGFFVTNTLFGHIDLVVEIHSWFIFIENLALGLIGFKIGTEMKFKKMRNRSKLIIFLLIAETTGAFIIVFTLIMLFTSNFLMSIIFAGLATATAPAVTIDIIIRLKAKGELTTITHWILALDDITAIITIETVLVFVSEKVGAGVHLVSFIIDLLHEIGLAVLIGFIIGFILDRFVEAMNNNIEMMEITIAFLLLGMGVAFYIKTSIIITAMMIGMTVTNIGGDNYAKATDLIEIVMSPILVLFFTLIGARITFNDLINFPFVAIIYLLARTLGKIGGFFVGGSIIGADKKIKNNIGFTFLAQGGVTLGLVNIITEKLELAGDVVMGHTIRTALIFSTILSVSLGAIGTNIAMKNAGEINS